MDINLEVLLPALGIQKVQIKMMVIHFYSHLIKIKNLIKNIINISIEIFILEKETMDHILDMMI